MVWKKQYADARRRRTKNDPEYRKKRNEQGCKDPEARKTYMRAYYQDNREKFVLDDAKKAKKNAARRERYKTDSAYRETKKQEVREYYKRNPDVRKRQQLKKYGITLEEYLEALALQGFACAICGYVDDGNTDGRFFPVVDHCHSANTFRGILCMNCNQGLGKFKDNIDTLQSAILYLTKEER